MIEGVRRKKLQVIPDGNGRRTEFLRHDWARRIG